MALTTLTFQVRRVLGNLSLPSSLLTITRRLWVDPNADFQKDSLDDLANQIAPILDELEEAGLAVNLGVSTNVVDLIAIVEADGRVPTLHPEKVEQWIDIASPNKRQNYTLFEGEMWYFTTAGLEMLSTS